MASTDSKSGEGAVVNVNASNPVAMTDHKAGPKESEVNVKNDQIMHGAQGARQDEGKAYGNFMHPMLAKMEEQVKAQTELLADMQRKWEEDRENERRKRMNAHIPGPLKAEGQPMADVMHRMENLIAYENFSENVDISKLIPAHLRELDETGDMAVLGHSLAAYISTLDFTHLRHFATRIISDTTLWISRLFRFNDSSAYFHDDEREGLARVCRLALHQKYPKFSSDGYEALYSRTPIIYISSAARPGVGQYICAQLGLPLSCLCHVPCGTQSSSVQKMDVAALEKLIADDIASAKMPVMLIAHAGSPMVGHVDHIDKLQEICQKNDMWLHLEGNNLATLAMFSVPTTISPAESGNSMTLNLGSWLGLPAMPFITLFKTADPTLAHLAGLGSFHLRSKLTCLPLWLCLQSMGHEGVVDRIKHAISLAKVMSEKVSQINTMKLVGKKSAAEMEDEDDVPRKPKVPADLIGKAVNAKLIFEIENPAVVFRYKADQEDRQDRSSSDTMSEDGDQAESPEKESYYDALNLWLSETLKREIPRVHVSTVDVEGEGLSIRFCPIESAQTFNTEMCDIEDFVECLVHQLQILDATVRQRPEFQDIVEAQDNLVLVHVPNWAGLGAVQYVPEHLLEQIRNLSEDGRRELNTLNTNLVHQLKSADTAFSLGSSVDQLACVRFGLITEETELEELIGLVYATGKEVEESSKFLETMAEVVKQGIEKAAQDLEKENQEKLQQEGVLRQVPLVGSFINWWSPPSKEVGIKGRTFNLTSGSIDSTESTYKYHMQVQSAQAQPEPRIKGPLKAVLKPRRTSGSSHDGQQSSPPQPAAIAGATPPTVENHTPQAAPEAATPETAAAETPAPDTPAPDTPAPDAAASGTAVPETAPAEEATEHTAESQAASEEVPDLR